MLPTRGSDVDVNGMPIAKAADFNPRSPRGGATAGRLMISPVPATFQSTLPTRGSDVFDAYDNEFRLGFQSTLPTRGCDVIPFIALVSFRDFNPRSPRGGATNAAPQASGRAHNFNPRSPRGGATLHGWAGQCTPLFQSTLPTRGSDCKCHVKMGLR